MPFLEAVKCITFVSADVADSVRRQRSEHYSVIAHSPIDDGVNDEGSSEAWCFVDCKGRESAGMGGDIASSSTIFIHKSRCNACTSGRGICGMAGDSE